MDEYIDLILEKALESFWTTVSEALPLITNGDMPPMSINQFDADCRAMIVTYLKNAEQ